MLSVLASVKQTDKRGGGSHRLWGDVLEVLVFAADCGEDKRLKDTKKVRN